MNRKFFNELVRFAIAGGISVATQFLVLVVFVELFRLNPTLSSGFGFIGGCIVNYLLLYYWTFKSVSSHHVVVFRYMAAMSISLSVNVLVFWTFTNAIDIWYVYSQCFATCCSSIFSFMINRFYTFV